MKHLIAAAAALLLLIVSFSPAIASDIDCMNDNDGHYRCATHATLFFGRHLDANGNRTTYQGLVDRAASAAGVPIRLARAVIRHESNFNPRLRGRAGEYGLGQIKCPTARGLGFSGSCSALFDPSTNLRWSMAYLKLAIEKGGPGCSGLSLYQQGIGAHPHCTHYGRQVLARRG